MPILRPLVSCVATIAVPAVVVEVNPVLANTDELADCMAVVRNAGTLRLSPELFTVHETPLAVKAVLRPTASVDALAVVRNDGTPIVAPLLFVVATIIEAPLVVVVAKLWLWLLCAAVVRKAGKFRLRPELFAVMLTPFWVMAVFRPIASFEALAVVR